MNENHKKTEELQKKMEEEIAIFILGEKTSLLSSGDQLKPRTRAATVRHLNSGTKVTVKTVNIIKWDKVFERDMRKLMDLIVKSPAKRIIVIQSIGDASTTGAYLNTMDGRNEEKKLLFGKTVIVVDSNGPAKHTGNPSIPMSFRLGYAIVATAALPPDVYLYENEKISMIR